MIADSNMCLRCFEYHGQQRKNCCKNTVICCSSCYRINYFTRECCHGPKRNEDIEYPQVFRLVGVQNTFFFTDIKVSHRHVAAMINTNLSTSKIDFAVLDALCNQPGYRFSMRNPTVPLPIKINNTLRNLDCHYTKLNGQLRLELGMDFLMMNVVSLKLDGLYLTPMRNGHRSQDNEGRYIIYVRIYGKDYAAIIDTGSSYSRMDLTVLTQIEDYADKTHSYNLIRSLVDVTMNWQNQDISMQFHVMGCK